MRETTCKVTCDKCGADIKGRDEWGLILDRWMEGDNSYVAWKADLCSVCADVLLSVIIDFVHLRYSED